MTEQKKSERLSIEEIMEHCNRTCEKMELLATLQGKTQDEIADKTYWEHYQVKNYLEDLSQYREIGTVEKAREYKEIADNIDAVSMAALCISLNKLKEYQSIGTVDECRAAMILKKKNATIKFPIMNSAMIPWEVLEPHEQQAIINHGQTLQRLAERGGLSWGEAAAILDDRKIEKKDMDERKSRDFVLKAIDDFYMVRARKKVVE